MEENAHSPSIPQVNPSPRSKTRTAIVWIAVLLVMAALFAVVLHFRSTPQTAAQRARRQGMGTVSVIPATAQKGDIGVYQEAIGTVTPVYTSSITSQVTGVITAVHYREGQLVRKGEPLIDIDARPFQAQVDLAQGTLEKDQHVLAQAQMDLERYRAAWAKNAVAKQTLDDQEKLVLQQQATVKADEGQLEYNKVQLSFCHIVAPFAGRVGLRLVDPGNIVQSNGTSPLVVVTQEKPITVIFTIAEDGLGQVLDELRKGDKLVVDAYDRAAQKKIATGRLLTLDNQIDTTTGTVKLRALFDNKDDALFPNLFVNARLLIRTLNGVTLIPTSTIQHNGPVSFVYVIQNGIAQMRTIKPGASDSGMTAVEGIQPGDVVANSSFEKLQPNAKVNIAQTNQPSGTTGSGMQ